VIGDILFDLVVTSSAMDTDFIVKFCVENTGRSITVLTIGSLRCKFRESWSDPKPLRREVPTTIKIHLGQTAYALSRRIPANAIDHEQRISAHLPHANTMAAPWHETNPVVARKAVRHGPNQLSRIQLPVIQ